MRIKDLMDPQGNWDINKLEVICLPYEAKAIRCVHIVGPDSQDKRYWRWEKKGSYTVKSGYWNFLKENSNLVKDKIDLSCSSKDSL